MERTRTLEAVITANETITDVLEGVEGALQEVRDDSENAEDAVNQVTSAIDELGEESTETAGEMGTLTGSANSLSAALSLTEEQAEELDRELDGIDGGALVDEADDMASALDLLREESYLTDDAVNSLHESIKSDPRMFKVEDDADELEVLRKKIEEVDEARLKDRNNQRSLIDSEELQESAEEADNLADSVGSVNEKLSNIDRSGALESATERFKEIQDNFDGGTNSFGEDLDEKNDLILSLTGNFIEAKDALAELNATGLLDDKETMKAAAKTADNLPLDEATGSAVSTKLTGMGIDLGDREFSDEFKNALNATDEMEDATDAVAESTDEMSENVEETSATMEKMASRVKTLDDFDFSNFDDKKKAISRTTEGFWKKTELPAFDKRPGTKPGKMKTGNFPTRLLDFTKRGAWSRKAGDMELPDVNPKKLAPDFKGAQAWIKGSDKGLPDDHSLKGRFDAKGNYDMSGTRAATSANESAKDAAEETAEAVQLENEVFAETARGAENLADMKELATESNSRLAKAAGTSTKLIEDEKDELMSLAYDAEDAEEFIDRLRVSDMELASAADRAETRLTEQHESITDVSDASKTQATQAVVAAAKNDGFADSIMEVNQVANKMGDAMEVSSSKIGRMAMEAETAHGFVDELAAANELTEQQATAAKRAIDEEGDATMKTTAKTLIMTGALDMAEDELEDVKEAAEDTGDQLGILSGDILATSLNIGPFNFALRNMLTNIPMLAMSVGSLATAFLGLATAVAAAGGAMAAFIGGGLFMMAQNIASTSSEYKNAMEAMEEVTKRLKKTFKRALGPLINGDSFDMFTKTVNGAASAINMVAQSMAQMQGRFMTFQSNVGTIFFKNWDAVLLQVQKTVQAFLPIIREFFGWIMRKLPQALQFLRQQTLDFLPALAGFAKTLVDFFVAFARFGVDVFSGFLPVLSFILDALAQLVNAVENLPDGVLQAAAAFGAFLLIGGKLIGVGRSLVGTFRALTTVWGKSDDALDAFTNVLQKSNGALANWGLLIDASREKLGRLKLMAWDMMSTLKRAAKSATGAAKRNLLTLGETAAQVAQDGFGLLVTQLGLVADKLREVGGMGLSMVGLGGGGGSNRSVADAVQNAALAEGFGASGIRMGGPSDETRTARRAKRSIGQGLRESAQNVAFAEGIEASGTRMGGPDHPWETRSATPKERVRKKLGGLGSRVRSRMAAPTGGKLTAMAEAAMLTGPSLSAPKMRGPSLRTPSLSAPSLSTPSMNTPSVNTPSMNAPSMTAGGLRRKLGSPTGGRLSTMAEAAMMTGPSLSAPKMRGPSLSMPRMSGPSMSAPRSAGEAAMRPFSKLQGSVGSRVNAWARGDTPSLPSRARGAVGRMASPTGGRLSTMAEAAMMTGPSLSAPKMRGPSISAPSLSAPKGLGTPSVGIPEIGRPGISAPSMSAPRASLGRMKKAVTPSMGGMKKAMTPSVGGFNKMNRKLGTSIMWSRQGGQLLDMKQRELVSGRTAAKRGVSRAAGALPGRARRKGMGMMAAAGDLMAGGVGMSAPKMSAPKMSAPKMRAPDIPNVGKKLTPKLQSFADKINTTALPAVSSLTDKLNTFGEVLTPSADLGVYDVLASKFNSVKTGVWGAIGSLKTFIVAQWRSIKTAIMNSSVVGWLSTVYGMLKTSILSAVGGLWSYITAQWAAITGNSAMVMSLAQIHAMGIPVISTLAGIAATFLSTAATAGIATGAMMAFSFALDAIGIGLVFKLAAAAALIAGAFGMMGKQGSQVGGIMSFVGDMLGYVFDLILNVGVPAWNALLDVFEFVIALGQAVNVMLSGIFGAMSGDGSFNFLNAILHAFKQLTWLFGKLFWLFGAFFDLLTKALAVIPGVNNDTLKGGKMEKKDAEKGASKAKDAAASQVGKMTGGSGKKGVAKGQKTEINKTTKNEYHFGDFNMTPESKANVKSLVKDALAEANRNRRLRNGSSG